MNLSGTRRLLPRSQSYAVGKRYTAQYGPLTHAMTPYLVLTMCAAFDLLVCAQEVVPYSESFVSATIFVSGRSPSI